MLVRIGCALTFATVQATPTVLLLAVHKDDRHQIVEEDRLLSANVAVHEYVDPFGNRIWRLMLPAASLRITYDALVDLSPDPDVVFPAAEQTPVEALPDHILPFTLPSRYCQSDLFVTPAWDLFGHVAPGWVRVQAICDWLHTHIAYGAVSAPTTSAVESFANRSGVCRDFAHLGIVFCRALNIPARYVCGYLPDIGVDPPDTPMDFHAWFEAYVDGHWRTFDARHNHPRSGRVPVGRGRDAVDVAFSTTYGSVDLHQMDVWADEVDTGGRILSGLRAGQLLTPRRYTEVIG